jgi:hypothetical protein
VAIRQSSGRFPILLFALILGLDDALEGSIQSIRTLIGLYLARGLDEALELLGVVRLWRWRAGHGRMVRPYGSVVKRQAQLARVTWLGSRPPRSTIRGAAAFLAARVQLFHTSAACLLHQEWRGRCVPDRQCRGRCGCCVGSRTRPRSDADAFR